MRIFNIHDTIAPVIEIASDTLYMTSLEYATNGAESNIVSVTKDYRGSVELFPNPATEYVELRMELDDVDRIELYNVWGQRVKVYEYDQMDKLSRIQLDISNVPQGSYSVRIMNDREVYTRQLIKVN